MKRSIRMLRDACLSATFLGVAGGCSIFGGMQSYEYPTPNATTPAPSADAEFAAAPMSQTLETPAQGHSAVAATGAQAVNVFGEFGDQPAAAPHFGTGGYRQVTFLDEGYDSDAEVSPDGQWIVFASTRHNEKAEIYLQKVGGASVTQLTSDGYDDAFPAFSPDGKRIAFCSTRGGSWDLYLMDIDGRNITQLTDSTQMQELHPSFSPDGKRLVYSATGTRSGQWELWTVDLQSMQRRMVGYGLFPSWSPRKDRDQIAFQRARQRGSRWFSLWRADLIDDEIRNMTEVAVSSNAAVVSPAWSPDSQQLAFSTIVNPSAAQSSRGGTQQDVWVMNADGSGRRRITDGEGVNTTPSWSADGTVFFISDRGGCDAVWSAQAGTARPVMQAQDRPEAATDPFANTDDGR